MRETFFLFYLEISVNFSTILYFQESVYKKETVRKIIFNISFLIRSSQS